MSHKIIHFEIPVSDTEKMSKFYSELFGWKFDKQSMPGMDYWMIVTTGSQNDLNGGMYVRSGEMDKPRFYVSVDDIDSHTERFKQAGGQVVIEKQEVPGVGYTVIGTDPEGNMIGLFQTTQPQNAPAPTSRRARSRSRPSRSKARRGSKQRRGRTARGRK